MSTPRFGRIPSVPDERDSRYPMRPLRMFAPPRPFKYYNMPPVLPLDQGDTGTCVAHAWTGFLVGAPIICKPTPNPYDMYRNIVLNDEFPDNDSEAVKPDGQLEYGSSVRGGVKFLQSRGYIKSYVWAHSAREMADWILGGYGTVVMGTNWYWDMSTVDKKGYINLGGGVAGGHAWLAFGYNRITKTFAGMNSWGRSWGMAGRFKIRFDDMDRLVNEDGEACSAVEQKIEPRQE